MTTSKDKDGDRKPETKKKKLETKKPKTKKPESNFVSPAFTLDELLVQVVDPSEPEIDWGALVGDEVW